MPLEVLGRCHVQLVIATGLFLLSPFAEAGGFKGLVDPHTGLILEPGNFTHPVQDPFKIFPETGNLLIGDIVMGVHEFIEGAHAHDKPEPSRLQLLEANHNYAGMSIRERTSMISDLRAKLFLLNDCNDAKTTGGSKAVAWPGGKVPYKFQSNCGARDRANFKAGLAWWEKSTCIRFTENGPRVNGRYFLDVSCSGCCYAALGMGGNTIAVGSANVHTNAHEVGHSLGLSHAQCRWDRDENVAVQWQGVIATLGVGFCSQYWRHSAALKGGEYLIDDSMHYDWYYGGRQHFKLRRDKHAYEVYPPGVELGETDILIVNEVHGCDTGPRRRRATPAPTRPPPGPCPNMKDCSFSEAHCRKKASKEGLKLGTSDYPFAGQYSSTGCYMYASGAFDKIAFYGYVKGGSNQEVTKQSELDDLQEPKERITCTHSCTSTGPSPTPRRRSPTARRRSSRRRKSTRRRRRGSRRRRRKSRSSSSSSSSAPTRPNSDGRVYSMFGPDEYTDADPSDNTIPIVEPPEALKGP